MTGTEKILNLLEINTNTPSLVVDDTNNIIACNTEWSEKYGSPEIGKSILKLFDLSSATLIKNSLIDAKTFDKIQRRQITFETEESIIERNLIISPFRISNKMYFYILIYSDLPARGEIFVYPSLDEQSLRKKYSTIFEELRSSLPQTLIERKNFQQLINAESEPIAVSHHHNLLFSNTAFDDYAKGDGEKSTSPQYRDIFETDLLEKIISAENEAVLNKNIFIVEQISENYSQNNPEIFILFPAVDNNDQVFAIIVFLRKRDIPVSEYEEKIEIANESENDGNLIEKARQSLDQPQIIYDKDDFDILSINERAVELYGYDAEEFKKLNMTQLFPPEDMQKLLSLPDMDEKERVKQIFKDGSIDELDLKVEKINLESREAYIATIFIEKEFKEEIIKREEVEDLKVDSKGAKVVEIPLEDDDISNFLSSLFHEILTPVNVILGFVQEIIDSLDDMTEEQSESAQIIKDNQQILLQTMNTAVQYAQLAERKIKLSLERFDFNNSLVDLQESIAQILSQKNINIEFDEIPESLSIYHDRSKLIFAISYFIRFIAKITESQKIFISAKITGNDFIVLVKDNEEGISDDIAANILKIFDPSENSKNDFGISLIAIKLANKLNEFLCVNIKEYVDPDGLKSIAFITTADFESIEKSISDELEVEESPISESTPVEKTPAIPDEDISESKPKPEVSEEYDSPIENGDVDEKIIEDISESKPMPEVSEEYDSPIENGDVNEKIIEDIEEEKEIVTEEIASIEEMSDHSFVLSNYSALFIDDNIDTQMLFESQMKDLKLLKVASNLTEALPLLNKYNFDFIFVDLNLNDVYNGLDAFKIIRQFSNYSTTPIIAITAYPFEGDKQKFIEFGFNDYLIKPLLRDQILNTLQTISS